MKPVRGGALVAAALAAGVAATFAEALTSPRVFYQRDILGYWYPHMAVFRRAVTEGAWPLWNPWVGFGSPLLADATFQLAYPPTWLALVLEPGVQFKALTIGHCLLAALGACALARRFGLGWTAAGTAGAAYALSGPLLSAASLFHHFAGAAWLPWLLFALEGLVRRPGLAAALPLGLVAGVQLLAGSGEMCLAGALLGTARLAWHLVRSRPPRSRVLVLGRGGAAAAALALALGAVQWLPTAERARDSYRAVLDARTNAYWSLHPGALFDLLVPRLATDLPLSEPARQALFEGREPLLACLYVGLVPLALGARGRAPRRRRAAAPAAGGRGQVVAARGRHTPSTPCSGPAGHSGSCAARRFLWRRRWRGGPGGGRDRGLGGRCRSRAAQTASWRALLVTAGRRSSPRWVAGPRALALPRAGRRRAAATRRTVSLKLARSALLLVVITAGVATAAAERARRYGGAPP
jgi:hypothetical protein